MSKVYLETERLIFRNWRDEDLEHFARINRDPIIMEYYPGRLDRQASEHLMMHFQKHIDDKGFGFFALEHKENSVFVGFAGLASVRDVMPFAPAIEMAWRLDYDFWGKGYAGEAGRGLLDFARDTLELEEIVAYCVESYAQRQLILEDLGFAHDAEGNFTYAPRRDPSLKGAYRLYRQSLSKPS